MTGLEQVIVADVAAAAAAFVLCNCPYTAIAPLVNCITEAWFV